LNHRITSIIPNRNRPEFLSSNSNSNRQRIWLWNQRYTIWLSVGQRHSWALSRLRGRVRGRVIEERRAFFGCCMNTLAVAYFRGSQRLVLRPLLLAQKPKRIEAQIKSVSQSFWTFYFCTEARKDLKGSGTDFVATQLPCRDARFRFMTIISWRSLRPFVPIPFLRWLHLGGDPVRDVRLARSRSARRSDPTDPGITRGYVSRLRLSVPWSFVTKRFVRSSPDNSLKNLWNPRNLRFQFRNLVKIHFGYPSTRTNLWPRNESWEHSLQRQPMATRRECLDW